MRTTMRGAILLLLTALAGLTIGALPASAHSRLISISPADKASLPSSPTEIVLTFNEKVNPEFVAVRVTDSEGGEVTDADATANGTKVTLPVAEPIAAGTYNVVYRVVSADSHPISGSTTFTVSGNPQAPPSTSPASPSTSPSATGSTPATPTTSSTATPSDTNVPGDADRSAPAESGGTPSWVWILVFVALFAAVGATFYAVRRDKSQS